jgi:hypothetical protein
MGKIMKRLLLVLPFVLAACDSGVTTAPRESAAMVASSSSVRGVDKGGTCTIPGDGVVKTGFDQYGYNRCAGNFVGLFGGWCADYGRGWDCLGLNVYGIADFASYNTYAKDHLVMKWNAAWDACNADYSPENCAGAWTDNEFNGMLPDGSRTTEHVKIVWIGGDCGADYTLLADGGYCIWGAYEAVMDQGKGDDGVRYVLAHAVPSGYGVKR